MSSALGELPGLLGKGAVLRVDQQGHEKLEVNKSKDGSEKHKQKLHSL
jgi:hypothetical protein